MSCPYCDCTPTPEEIEKHRQEVIKQIVKAFPKTDEAKATIVADRFLKDAPAVRITLSMPPTSAMREVEYQTAKWFHEQLRDLNRK